MLSIAIYWCKRCCVVTCCSHACCYAPKVNGSLRVLNVNNTGFGDEGAAALLEMLRQNEGLATLSAKKVFDAERAAAFRVAVQQLQRPTPLELVLE